MLSVTAGGRPAFAVIQRSKPKNPITTNMSTTFRTIRDFLAQHAASITHTVVAHTRYSTYERSDLGMQRVVSLAKQDCRHFRNCFNKRLYGRRASRRPLVYQPLLIATLEGSLITTDRDLTLHYNFAIGNVPVGMTDRDLMSALRASWVEQAGQRDDIRMVNVAGDPAKALGWIGYSLKEAEDRGHTDVWDFENTQIPYTALDAG